MLKWMCAALLVALVCASARAQKDTASTSSAMRMSIAFGALYENFGMSAELQYSTHHFVAALRRSGMMADHGPGGLIDFSAPSYLPREELTDYAAMAGYGMFGRHGYVELLGGLSYSSGVLRGAYDSAEVTPHSFNFYGGSDTTTKYFESHDFANYGYTVEAKAAFGNDAVGLGASVFVTKSSALTYAGLMLDVYIGVGW